MSTQLYRDFEVVIVDDGSKAQERVGDDISSDPRVRVTRHASNRGPSAARNTGVVLAQGAWLAFLDSDDLWLPGKVRPQVELLGSETDVGLVHAEFEPFDSDTGRGESDRSGGLGRGWVHSSASRASQPWRRARASVRRTWR